MKKPNKQKQQQNLKLLGRSYGLWALGSLVFPGIALSQEVNPGGAIVTGDSKLEEVMVTARRREEGISRVPISISAIASEELLERSIRTDSDLQSAVPGLTIRQTQGNNSLTYAIRGQSADTFSGSPSAVVAYLDEVPMTISGASTFYDLESIQVLKGPQGTLFGRNTTGGAVLYTTAKPTEEFEGLIRLRGGNYDLQEIEGMINVPLAGNKVLLRGAFNTLDRDGYIDNLFTGEELGELGRDSGRLAMTIRPSDRFENTTVFSYSETDGTNTGASYTYSVYQCGDTNKGYALNCGSAFLFGPTLDVAFDFPGAWDAYLAGNPKAYPPGLAAYVDEQKRLGYYKTNHPAGASHEGEDWLLSNTTTYDLSDNFRIRNIFGASHAETDSEQPQLGAPFVTILTANVATGKSGNEFDVDSISNELQLQGFAFNGELTYIAGLFVQRQESETLWPQTYFDLRPVAGPLSLATNNFGIDTDTEALYAQGTYNFTPRFSVSAGFRYTWEEVTIEHLSQGDAAGFPDQDETFEEPSWELGVEYDFTDNVFTYVKAGGSFRSGGFNGSAFPPIDASATVGGNKFDEETTEDVEAGLKYAGTVLGRPASFNIALYKQWIDDVQRVEFPDPDGDGPLASIAVTANVPEMEVEGVELDGSLLVADWLELGFAYAYTDAEFTDGEVQLFGTLYRYGPVANTPENAGSAWAQFIFPESGLGEFRFRAELYAQSNMYFSNTFDSLGPDTKLDGYELVNARLDWKNILGSGFSGALFGRNITDEDHFVGGMPLAAALGHNAAAVGEPLTWGLELTYAF